MRHLLKVLRNRADVETGKNCETLKQAADANMEKSAEKLHRLWKSGPISMFKITTWPSSVFFLFVISTKEFLFLPVSVLYVSRITERTICLDVA